MAKKYVDVEILAKDVEQTLNAINNKIFYDDLKIALEVVLRWLRAESAADVQEVRHGEWIHYADCGVTCCSNCNWSIEECYNSNYCPYCGCKMDGGENNDREIL